MVVKLFRDHDPEHLAQPITRGEFKRIMREVIGAMGIFGVVITVALFIATSAQHATAKQADAIQTNRFQTIRDTCRDTNERNRETLLKLGQVALNGPARGQTRREQQQSMEGARIVINAILPVRADCDAYARKRIALP